MKEKMASYMKLQNNVDQIPELVEYYDFAINEACFQYGECSSYRFFTQRRKV
jgi:hypothetical protein